MSELTTLKQPTMSSLEIADLKASEFIHGIICLDEIAEKISKAASVDDVSAINDCYSEFEQIKHLVPKTIQVMFYFYFGSCYASAGTNKSNKNQKTYLVQNSTTGLYKIGKTANEVKIRVAQFTGMSAGDNYIHGFIDRDIEQQLHKKYKDKRIKGEWFDLSQQDVNEILELFGVNSA